MHGWGVGWYSFAHSRYLVGRCTGRALISHGFTDLELLCPFAIGTSKWTASKGGSREIGPKYWFEILFDVWLFKRAQARSLCGCCATSPGITVGKMAHGTADCGTRGVILESSFNCRIAWGGNPQIIRRSRSVGSALWVPWILDFDDQSYNVTRYNMNSWCDPSHEANERFCTKPRYSMCASFHFCELAKIITYRIIADSQS